MYDSYFEYLYFPLNYPLPVENTEMNYVKYDTIRFIFLSSLQQDILYYVYKMCGRKLSIMTKK